MGRPKKQPTSNFIAKYIHQNAMAFCIENGVKIYPVLLKNKEYKLNIEINQNGLIKNIESPVQYSKHELTEKIYEIYLYYFKKMANEDIVRKSRKKYVSFNNN